MAWALASPIDSELRGLLALRRRELLEHTGYDLGELAHFLIVEPEDTLAAIEKAAGVPFSVNLVESTRLGEPDFVPNFEFVQRHGDWYEAVTILSDDGFGLVLFVPDLPGIDRDLLRLVRDHA
ncbi:MAG: hypothetical protein V4459_01240 [Pseudomonadota bacterium]